MRDRVQELLVVAAFCAGALAPRAAPAVGSGNDLLPDLPAHCNSVRLEEVADVGPSIVMDIANAGDGSGRLFLVSPDGVVRVLSGGSVLATPFLDAPASPTDRAMSGLAFHPDYATNGRLFLITGEATPNGSVPDYSAPQDDTASAFDNVLVEYLVDANDPNTADASSRRELLRVHQAHRLHNVDDLAFGGEGLLYVSVGDGGTTRDGTPSNYETTAQQTDNPFGSILRLDVDVSDANDPYEIPADNPFADDPNLGIPEIFAWGVRNPWRISADRLTGEIYTGVNGDITIEQVYRVENGRNYGWALKEGSFLWDPNTGAASVDPSPDPNLTPPLGEYDHNGTTEAFGSVIGGSVYRGAALEGFWGKYLATDYVASRLLVMDAESGAIEVVPLDPNGASLGTGAATKEITWGEDEAGELYLGRADGKVLRLVPDGSAVDWDCDGVLDDGDGSGTAGDLPCSCQDGEDPGICAAGCDDNCLFRVNPDQLDRGGVHAIVLGNGSPDGLGDPCQCGDMNGDGIVNSTDLVLYRRSFAGQISPFSTDRCSVTGTDGACDASDLVVMRRTFAGQTTGILADVCPAWLGLRDPGAP